MTTKKQTDTVDQDIPTLLAESAAVMEEIKSANEQSFASIDAFNKKSEAALADVEQSFKSMDATEESITAKLLEAVIKEIEAELT